VAGPKWRGAPPPGRSRPATKVGGARLRHSDEPVTTNAQSIHHTFHLQCVAILCGRVSDSYSQYKYTLTGLHSYLALEYLTLGIPHTKLHTKFEVYSSSSFRDIAL